jgi:hypothetical protein
LMRNAADDDNDEEDAKMENVGENWNAGENEGVNYNAGGNEKDEDKAC